MKSFEHKEVKIDLLFDHVCFVLKKVVTGFAAPYS